MKSSEISTVNSSQLLSTAALPDDIKKAIEEKLDTIKVILKKNLQFFQVIVSEVMNIGKKIEGKNVYYNDIEDLLYTEYPNLLKYEAGFKLRDNIYQLAQYVCSKDRENIEFQIQYYLHAFNVESEELEAVGSECTLED